MGKLAEIKTKPTSSDVVGFIDSISDEQQRKDSHVILKGVDHGPWTIDHGPWKCIPCEIQSYIDY